MPHHILGLGWDELASIISIFTIIFGGFIGWLVHTVNDNFSKNSKPLNESIDNLSNVIQALKMQLSDHQKSIDDVSHRMERLNDHVVDHEARIKVLEKEEEDKDD